MLHIDPVMLECSRHHGWIRHGLVSLYTKFHVSSINRSGVTSFQRKCQSLGLNPYPLIQSQVTYHYSTEPADGRAWTKPGFALTSPFLAKP